MITPNHFRRAPRPSREDINPKLSRGPVNPNGSSGAGMRVIEEEYKLSRSSSDGSEPSGGVVEHHDAPMARSGPESPADAMVMSSPLSRGRKERESREDVGKMVRPPQPPTVIG